MGKPRKKHPLFVPRKATKKAHPGYGTDMRAIETWARSTPTPGVDRLTAGPGITLTPPTGTGVVEVSASGGTGRYASLTGPGATTTPGALTQRGQFTVTLGTTSRAVVGFTVTVGTTSRVVVGGPSTAPSVLISGKKPVVVEGTTQITVTGTANILIHARLTTLFTGSGVEIHATSVQLAATGGNVAFYGKTPAPKPTVTGSRGGNAAVTSLLTALTLVGLVSNTTTP